MSDNSGATGLIVFGIGLLTGLSVAYLILKGKEQQPAVLSQQPQTLMQTPDEYWHLKAELQRLTIELLRQRQENSDLRAQLQIAAPQGQAITSATKDSNISQNTTPKKDNTPKLQAVHNEETWEIKKDKRGRLEGVTVHRMVTPVG
jgi:uncharacterized membrane protein YccC